MHLRSILSALAALALLSPAQGMSKKQIISVRFHTETSARDQDSFSIPVTLEYQRRATHIGRVPALSEQQIQSAQPFPAGDGTWGCVFKLNEQGRLRLESFSGESRGAALVVFVATKAGQHQVVDMIIDRQVSDGIISIPRGLTDLETAALREQFKPLKAEKPKKPGKNDEADNWKMDRDRAQRPGKMPAAPAPLSRGRATEPDLPRIAD